jgi:hypothetical protein
MGALREAEAEKLTQLDRFVSLVICSDSTSASPYSACLEPQGASVVLRSGIYTSLAHVIVVLSFEQRP